MDDALVVVTHGEAPNSNPNPNPNLVVVTQGLTTRL